MRFLCRHKRAEAITVIYGAILLHPAERDTTLEGKSKPAGRFEMKPSSTPWKCVLTDLTEENK